MIDHLGYEELFPESQSLLGEDGAYCRGRQYEFSDSYVIYN